MNVQKLMTVERIEAAAEKFGIHAFTEGTLAAAVELELKIEGYQVLLAGLYAGKLQAEYLDGQEEPMFSLRTGAQE